MASGNIRGEYEGALLHVEAQRFQAPSGELLSIPRSVNRLAAAGAAIALVPRKGRVLYVLAEPAAAAFVVTLKPGDYSAARTFTTVDQTENTADVTAHGFETGDGPYLLTTSGALPAGLAAATKYWLRAVSVDDVAFYLSEADAVNDANRVDITGAGSGTQTINSSISNGALPTTAVTNDTAEVRLYVSANTLGQPQKPIAILAPHKLTLGISAAGSVAYWFGA